MRRLVLLALVGLVAQLVDGSLGMGYGVTSATLLVAAGIAPAAASAAIHFSELGTTLVSGLSHHKLGNTDWRTVGVLAAPGFVGAFAGATLLVSLDTDVAVPVVAVLLIALGTCVTWRFLAPRRLRFGPRPSARFLAPLGLFAGALDAVGGGGWGPVGTSSLLASGRLEPRKVVGSVDTAEFVVAVGGSLGFLVGLGAHGIQWAYVARADGGRHRGGADRGAARALPAGPGARRGRRRPDRAHQPADAGRLVGRDRGHRGAARLAGLHAVGALDRVGGQDRAAGGPRGPRTATPVGA